MAGGEEGQQCDEASGLSAASVASASQWLGAHGGRLGRYRLAGLPGLEALKWRHHFSTGSFGGLSRQEAGHTASCLVILAASWKRLEASNGEPPRSAAVDPSGMRSPSNIEAGSRDATA